MTPQRDKDDVQESKDEHVATKVFLIWKEGLENIPEYKREIQYFRDLLSNPPEITYDMFFQEYIWVVFNSGWKEQIARKYVEKFMKDHDPSIMKNHRLKYPALTSALEHSHEWFDSFNQTETKLEYLRSLPMMGGEALGYHLARNLGIDCVKPDRWLKRLAKRFAFETPLELCQRVQIDIGNTEKLGVIDVIFWRGANLGFGDTIL
jgi:hypothetical protein